MTRWWRRGAADGVPAAVRSAEALRAVLDNAPAVLLVADEAGDIVYRNKAAEELLRQTAATGGQKVLLALRDSLKDDIRTARSFPSVKTTPLTVDGRTMYGSSTLTRIPGGYVVTWTDTTAQVETAAVVRDLARELTAASTALTDAGQELVDRAGHTAERAAAVSNGSVEMTASIREISTRVTTAASSSGTAATSARAAARTMEHLQGSSQQIGSITELIRAIAEQTKLLALNATIESARAGEMGRGFAVVAGEVKDLASRTAEATRQIVEMIEGIQGDSTRAVGDIGAIVDLIDEVAQQQTMIAGAVEEQTATSAEMSGGMRSVAESVNASAGTAQTVLAAAASLRDQAMRLSQLTV